MLGALNEGEGDVGWDLPGAAPAQKSETQVKAEALMEAARADPERMRELMQRGHEAQRAKKARLSQMVSASFQTQGDYTAGAGGNASNTTRPRNFRQERLAAERAPSPPH